MLSSVVLLAALALGFESQEELDMKWGSDWSFSGITTFAHLPSNRCLVNPDQEFDIAVIGVPFDTAVSYRPGARFGPRAIRAASMRQTNLRGFNPRAGFNPYQDWATVLDCEDIPVTPMDNKLALNQMTDAFTNLLAHNTSTSEFGKIPRLVALGGDHSIILPHLRALNKHYGPISVIHFDAHLDTWLPSKYPSGWAENLGSGIGDYTHGTMFYLAHEEGLLSDKCVHAGLRTRLSGADYEDYLDDTKQGFARITSDDIDDLGTAGIASLIKRRIPKDAPVYISVDIDVIDPGTAPGTGTPESGGWTTRELIRLLRSIGDLNIVAADIVEVAPAYDHAENTALAGAQVAFELITSMVQGRSTSAQQIDPSRKEWGIEESTYMEMLKHRRQDTFHDEV